VGQFAVIPVFLMIDRMIPP